MVATTTTVTGTRATFQRFVTNLTTGVTEEVVVVVELPFVELPEEWGATIADVVDRLDEGTAAAIARVNE